VPGLSTFKPDSFLRRNSLPEHKPSFKVYHLGKLQGKHGDNYIALMPGERLTIRTELEHADTRGETPWIVVEGFNVWNVKKDIEGSRPRTE